MCTGKVKKTLCTKTPVKSPSGELSSNLQEGL